MHWPLLSESLFTRPLVLCSDGAMVKRTGKQRQHKQREAGIKRNSSRPGGGRGTGMTTEHSGFRSNDGVTRTYKTRL